MLNGDLIYIKTRAVKTFSGDILKNSGNIEILIED